MIGTHGLDKKAAAPPVVRCANYLVKNTRWLHYDRALADGCPVAVPRGGACQALNWHAPAILLTSPTGL